MKRSFATARIGALTILLAMSAAGARAQDTDLSAARDLYASAAYDDALAVLNRLGSSDHAPSQSRAAVRSGSCAPAAVAARTLPATRAATN